MPKMLAASHERPICCRDDDDFYRPGRNGNRVKRMRKRIQRRREQRRWQREVKDK